MHKNKEIIFLSCLNCANEMRQVPDWNLQKKERLLSGPRGLGRGLLLGDGESLVVAETAIGDLEDRHFGVDAEVRKHENLGGVPVLCGLGDIVNSMFISRQVVYGFWSGQLVGGLDARDVQLPQGPVQIWEGADSPAEVKGFGLGAVPLVDTNVILAGALGKLADAPSWKG